MLREKQLESLEFLRDAFYIVQAVNTDNERNSLKATCKCRNFLLYDWLFEVLYKNNDNNEKRRKMSLTVRNDSGSIPIGNMPT